MRLTLSAGPIAPRLGDAYQPWPRNRNEGEIMKNTVRTMCLAALIYWCWMSQVMAQKPSLVVQTGHQSYIMMVGFSPEGKVIASGSADRTIKLWDLATGREL